MSGANPQESSPRRKLKSNDPDALDEIDEMLGITEHVGEMSDSEDEENISISSKEANKEMSFERAQILFGLAAMQKQGRVVTLNPVNFR